MRSLFPYPVLAGEIALDVREVRLDGIPLDFTMINPSERVVALHDVERENWHEARLSVRLKVPQRELASNRWSNVIGAVTAAEPRTHTRTVQPLMERDGHWEGELALLRDRHLDQIALSAQVIATVDGVSGRLIGRTDRTWTVDLQARQPTEDEYMTTVWKDFSDPSVPFLHAFKDDAWSVDASGEKPIIYLNTRFEGLDFLLSGRDRQLANMVSAEIAAGIWTALFGAAAFAADEEDGELHWPGGWKNAVLHRMLPLMFTDRSPEDALTEVIKRRRAGVDGGDLQMRLVHAAGIAAERSRSLGAFARTAMRKDTSA